MTIEEAIKVLRTESIELGGPSPSVCRFLEALDMAISALRQQETVAKCNGLNEPLTNAQKIRSMSDEELAVLIAREIVHVPHSGFYVAKSAWLRWLQETVEEDDHA